MVRTTAANHFFQTTWGLSICPSSAICSKTRGAKEFFLNETVKPESIDPFIVQGRQPAWHMQLAPGRADALFAEHEDQLTRAVDDIEALAYCLAFLAAGDLPWRNEPDTRALSWKRKLMTDGWAALAASGGAAEQLTMESAHPSDAAAALHALWAEVIACHQSGSALDYDACLVALGEGRGDPPFDWE